MPKLCLAPQDLGTILWPGLELLPLFSSYIEITARLDDNYPSQRIEPAPEFSFFTPGNIDI